MAILYKTFTHFRIAPTFVLIAAVLCGVFMPFKTLNANTLFTIENVRVDVTAENAIMAREQAFEKAQLMAFEELKSRMLSDAQAEAFYPPPIQTISTMIQDYEVSNEKLSSKRYIGTYKVRFKDRAVKRYFTGQGTQYTDIASRPVLILPFFESEQGTVLWARNNPWMQAWASAPGLSGGLVPLIVPLGDLADVSDIGDDEALTYNRRSLISMTGRYNATEAVIAIARPEGTGLNVQLYRTDRARPEYVHQILERSLTGQEQNSLYARAVQTVRQALRKDWKKKTVVEASEKGFIQVRTAFQSLKEWANFQSNLKNVQGISKIDLKALSPKEAYLDISYEGNIERLRLSLQQSGLYLNTSSRSQTRNERGNYPAQDYSQGLLGAISAQKTVIYELSAARADASQPYYSHSGGKRSPESNIYQRSPSVYQRQPYRNQF